MNDGQTVERTGVQELIDRLRDDGVAAGREEAERLILEARKAADRILEGAKAEAEAMLGSSREQIRSEQESAQEALGLAIRDARLKLASEITARFRTQVQRLVSQELSSPDLVKKVILAVAGSSLPEELRDPQVQLFVKVLQGGEDEQHSQEFRELIGLVSTGMLREGVDIRPLPSSKHGIKVRASDKDIEIDLTEDAIAELLIEHLVPRFRTLYMRGLQKA